MPKSLIIRSAYVSVALLASSPPVTFAQVAPKQEFESAALNNVLRTARDQNTVAASRREEVAETLKKAANIARDARLSEEGQVERRTEDGRPVLTTAEFEEIENLRRAKLLRMEAVILKAKAGRQNSVVEGAKLDRLGFPECQIRKTAPLEFVPTLDEVRDQVDHTVMGHLDGRTLTILQDKIPRLSFDVRSVELPIFNVPDTGDTCYGFKYHGTDQIFCTTNPLARDSWIDALTEAWFCQVDGLQGTLSNANSTEDAIRKKTTSAPLTTTTTTPAPALDLAVTFDSQGAPGLTLNGRAVKVSKHT